MLVEQIERAILFPNRSHQLGWCIAHGCGRGGGTRPIFGGRCSPGQFGGRAGSRHQGAYYQHLVRELGIPTGPLEPVLAVPGLAIEEARSLLRTHGWEESQPMLVVAPGAAYGTAKRWLPRHFAALISRAIRETGVQAVLVGAQADAESARLVLDSTGRAERGAIVDLTGATTLQTLAGVMSLAAACVSNDSGAMHLAGAVGTPLAALFGPTSREGDGAVDAPRRAIGCVDQSRLVPAVHAAECPFDHQCMTGLKPERVFDSVRVLMGTQS
jgi:heptosyltransferase-2